MELLAKSGKYQVIWAHSSYSDQVKALKDKYPDVLFVVVGSGNEGLGGNVYYDYKRVHEPSYLLGVLAGRMTKSDTVGVVGQFPSEDVNDQINSFFAGAKSVNPDVKRKVAFIESWYDPAKAEQFTNAQISAGADLIFQLAGSFETCEKGQHQMLRQLCRPGRTGAGIGGRLLADFLGARPQVGDRRLVRPRRQRQAL